jgi:DUF1680 family protein
MKINQLNPMNIFRLSIATLLITSFQSTLVAQGKAPTAVQDSMVALSPGQMQVGGYIGTRIDLCMAHRIAAQDADELVRPFYLRNESKFWQTEFWGKWVLSAITAYQYEENATLKQKIDRSLESIIASQSRDGYIGNYADTSRLQHWDIWGQKYTMLGLLACYDLTGKKNALRAAVKLADYLISVVGPGKVNIVKTGLYRGMPSCSVLEPIVLLYNRTKDPRYLKFAEYIVGQIETPEGPQLVEKALAGIPVGKRFPQAANWWSWNNGEKAYEMMSCYDGMLELYRVTGNSRYLKPVVLSARSIAETELTIAGGASSIECWYGGRQNQVRPSLLSMETCVTQTWMKLCHKLLTITGDPVYADYIETSYYNALLAAMTPDGSSFAKYSAMSGYRTLGEDQCGMKINCCIANGPRAIVQFPATAVMSGANSIFINLYAKSSANVKIASANVRIDQLTDYPKSDSVMITVSPDTRSLFTLNLRIPGWSAFSEVRVNGSKVYSKPGEYVRIFREWKKGDIVTLRFDLRGRVTRIDGYAAIQRGPVLLTRDSRFNSADFIDEEGVPMLGRNAGTMDEMKTGKPAGMWMAFKVPFQMGSNHELNDGKRLIPFTDFSSAGNDWQAATRLKTWIVEPLDPKKIKP